MKVLVITREREVPRRALLAALGSFAPALRALLGSQSTDVAAARMGALGGKHGGRHGRRKRLHNHHHHRRKRTGKRHRQPDGKVSWVTLNVTNLTAHTLDIRGYTACLKSNGEESVDPGDTREISSSIYFAAAWINGYYATIIDRGNDIALAHDGSWDKKRCYHRGVTDLKVDGVEVGQTLDQTIEDYRFVLVREEDEEYGQGAFYRLNVHNHP